MWQVVMRYLHSLLLDSFSLSHRVPPRPPPSPPPSSSSSCGGGGVALHVCEW